MTKRAKRATIVFVSPHDGAVLHINIEPGTKLKAEDARRILEEARAEQLIKLEEEDFPFEPEHRLEDELEL